jgi:general secretion pathway protein J
VRPPRGAAGFTLLELLVSMSLLSLVMLGTGSALRGLSQLENRIDRRLAQVDELRVAAGFLRSILSRVSARRADAPASGPQAQPFAGGADGLRWVGVMPARHGAAGMHHLLLRIEPAGLVLRHAAWRGDAAPDWVRAGSVVLVAGATRLDARYEDARSEPARWVDRWTAADAMPQRVSLSVVAPSGPWPALVVALRRLAGTDPDLAGGPAPAGK